MAIALLRRQYLTHFLSFSVSNSKLSLFHSSSFGCQQRVKYTKWSNFFTRELKPNNVRFCSSSSSSTTTTAITRNRFVSWYLRMVKSRPILTKSITSSLIYIAADFTSQTISLPSSEPYDFLRTLRMAGYGLVILGPSLHYWFNFMSRILPGHDLLTTVKKMALGQTLFGPFMTIVFFSGNAAMQGEQPREIAARLKRDLLPTMLNGVMYWPVCDFITFKFVPVHLQPLVSNSFSYVWTVYITYMASLEKASIS